MLYIVTIRQGESLLPSSFALRRKFSVYFVVKKRLGAVLLEWSIKFTVCVHVCTRVRVV